jgi:hypothetical protein
MTRARCMRWLYAATMLSTGDNREQEKESSDDETADCIVGASNTEDAPTGDGEQNSGSHGGQANREPKGATQQSKANRSCISVHGWLPTFSEFSVAVDRGLASSKHVTVRFPRRAVADGQRDDVEEAFRLRISDAPMPQTQNKSVPIAIPACATYVTTRERHSGGKAHRRHLS